MASRPKAFLTPEAYLALERRAETRSAYHDGTIVAMAGASREHNLIRGNTYRELSTQLRRGPCRVVASDMRVWIPTHRVYTYPDTVAACGPPQFQHGQPDILLNPALIIEILSPSTEAYDRGRKFAQYRTIPTLVEYVSVAQDEARIDYYRREPGGPWFIGDARGREATLALTIGDGCTLALADIYERIELPG